MSPGQPNDLPNGIDELRDAYRAADFGDEPPAHVDALILEAARREGKRRMHAYLPPLAMAATVLLALGLVLRLTMPMRDATPAADAPASLRAPAVVDEPEAQRALPTESDASAADSVVPTRQSTTAATAASPATSEGVASAGRAEQQYLASEAVTEACSSLRGGDPTPWLECIRLRVADGELDEARTELSELILVYPDFPIPEELTEQLRP